MKTERIIEIILMEGLRGCPRCGSKRIIMISNPNDVTFKCGCGLSSPKFEKLPVENTAQMWQRVAEWWNTRASVSVEDLLAAQ